MSSVSMKIKSGDNSNNFQVNGDNIYLFLMHELVSVSSSEDALKKLLSIEDKNFKKADKYNSYKVLILIVASFAVIIASILFAGSHYLMLAGSVAFIILLSFGYKYFHKQTILPARTVEAAKTLSIEILKYKLLENIKRK